MAPIVNGLEEKYDGQVRFVHLDIDDPANRPMLRALGVGWPPVFYLLDGDGKLLERMYLYKEGSELDAMIQRHLAN